MNDPHLFKILLARGTWGAQSAKVGLLVSAQDAHQAPGQALYGCGAYFSLSLSLLLPSLPRGPLGAGLKAEHLLLR